MIAKSGMPVHSIGLMSGTSADGVDGVVLKIHDSQFTLVDSESLPYSATLRQSVRETCAQKIKHRSEAKALENQLNKLFIEVAMRLVDRISPIPVCVVGCHGQTVHHSPDSNPPFTVQLADGAAIAGRTGIPAVTDFRSQDIAAGGQGAPLAPGFHMATFHSPDEHRAVINIGGIANITILPKEADGDVVGFDIGPGNCLMDNWCLRHFSSPFDAEGRIAESGAAQLDLLGILLDDAYFSKPHPKSTGIELFNLEWLDVKLREWKNISDLNAQDVLATLSALTAHTICETVNRIRPKIGSVFICGGGAMNIGLMRQIRANCRATVLHTATLGFGPAWVEAAAFAWMAYQTTLGIPSTIPSVTGAKYPCIAGVINTP